MNRLNPHFRSATGTLRWAASSVAAIFFAASPTLAQDGESNPGASPPVAAPAAPSSALPAEGSDDAAAADAEGAAPAPPPAAAAPVKKANPPNTLMRDDTSEARREALEDLVRRYEEEALDFREQVRLIAERKYTERKAKIEANYKKALAPVQALERRNREDAIAAFERFLERHPNNKTYTPDALFRLAELYFEKYDDAYQQKMADYRDAFAAWSDAGGNGEPPDEPQQHFERTIALYQRLITDFPNYRLIDGAYYLLGFTLNAQGEQDEAMKMWRALVTRYPDSRFYAEVWFRIGDYHFEEEEWPQAIEAFAYVVPLTDSTYYDKGLYKLAWTYYLTNSFDASVERFFELLDFSYKRREEEGDGRGSVLEEEAIQYVGISFADDTWKRPDRYKTLISGDSLDDEFADVAVDYVQFAKDYFAQAGKKPYERDVMAKLGDILFKQSKNRQAIAALKHAIALDPLARNAPQMQDLVVQAWEREREFSKASAERDILVANYSKGSDWYNKWLNDSDARKEAENIAKVSLYKAAIFYHQSANKDFEEGRTDVAVKNYAAAAAAYGEYLQRYPHDKEAYELSYYLAETYYYSLAFEKAIAAYEAVRDSTQGQSYRDDAALAAIYSYEKVIELAIKEGTLDEKDIFAANETPIGERQAEPIPQLRQDYVKAIDKFLERGKDNEQAPAFAYKAAAIYYSHAQFDEALKRLTDVTQQYPSHEAAKFAANFILDFYVGTKQWAKVAELSKQFESNITGGDQDDTFKKLGSGAEFQLAKALLEDGDKALSEGRIQEGLSKLEQGANEYLRLLEEDPKRDFADLMMYNAALSLEKARRPARAAELYERLYKEYPESSYAAEAMFRVASKSEQAFSFDKAVATYLQLVKKYPTSERRADAQINAALALEGQQKYERAARELIRFADLFPERKEAPDVFYRAAIVQKKRGDAKAEIDTLKKFIKRFGREQANAPRVVEAHVRLGDIYAELAGKTRGKTRRNYLKASSASFRDAVKQFNRASGSANAAYYAGKAAFRLADTSFESYDKMKIEGRTGKKQGAALLAKTKRLQEVEGEFKSVITKYRQAEWSLAALYRIGALYDDLQKSMIEAPCPADIRRIDEIACDEYKIVLEDQAFAVEEKAVQAYRAAYERALELKLTNKWTKQTLEALNLLRPAEFPINKEPLTKPNTGDVYSMGLVYENGGAQQLLQVGGTISGPVPGTKKEGGGNEGTSPGFEEELK